MATVKEVMISNVLVVTKTTTVVSAVSLMANNEVSCLVVVDGEKPIGILTERDLVRKIMAPAKSSKRLKVEEIMNTPLVAVNSTTTLEEASNLMQSTKIRRLPVVDEEKLKGIVTETDIVREMAKMATANRRMTFYQNLQSWILIAFFILLSIVLLFRLL